MDNNAPNAAVENTMDLVLATIRAGFLRAPKAYVFENERNALTIVGVRRGTNLVLSYDRASDTYSTNLASWAKDGILERKACGLHVEQVVAMLREVLQ